MWIAIFLVAFFLVLTMRRQNRIEENLHRRVFALEYPDLVAGLTIRDVTIRPDRSISGPHWN